MSILVFILGGLLSAGGALAIYFGYDIVQVERGWSSVIGGAAALSGGVVTIGLGFVLRALGDLKTAFRQGQSLPLVAPALPITAVSAVEPVAVEPLAVELAAAPLEAINPSIDASALHAAILQAVEPIDAADAVKFEPPKPIVETGAVMTPSEVRPTVSDMWRLVNEESEPPLDLQAPQKDDAAKEPKLFPEPPAIQPERPEPVEPPAALRSSPQPESVETPIDRREDKVEDIVAMPLAAAPEPPPAVEPTVIGRYESEGTTYTMFADGSIEAQSDEGIFRFASMAELKAFVESRA